MKAESKIAPSSVTIEETGDVILTENAVLIDKDGEGFYQYDSYRINVPIRPNLKESIEANFAEWLAFAKAESSKPVPLTVPQKVEMHDAELSDIVTILEAIL